MKDAAAALQRVRPGVAVYDRQRKAKWAKHLAGCWQRCDCAACKLPAAASWQLLYQAAAL